MKRLHAPAIAALATVLCGNLLFLAVGASPIRVWTTLLASTWGNGYGVAQVLFRATTLSLAGLSVALALRAGLFNVGAEGQLSVGTLATTLVGIALPASWPSALAVPVAVTAGFLAGAACGAIPGLLRARFRTHEVLSTLLLNFVFLAGIGWLVSPGRLALPETRHTAEVSAAVRIARLGDVFAFFHGSAASFAVLLAPGVALGLALLLRRTRFGLDLRAVAAAPGVAEAAGVRVGRTIAWTMTLSGGIAGLVGAGQVLGYKHRFEADFAGGAGFLGIAVAVLGRGHPLGVLAAALLFATLSQGALAVNGVVPKEALDVVTATIVLGALAVLARRRT